MRQFLLARGTLPVIPNNPTRKRHHPVERSLYRRRNVIERTFYRLKGFRRVVTRHDRLAITYDAAVCLATILLWRL